MSRCTQNDIVGSGKAIQLGKIGFAVAIQIRSHARKEEALGGKRKLFKSRSKGAVAVPQHELHVAAVDGIALESGYVRIAVTVEVGDKTARELRLSAIRMMTFWPEYGE